MSFFYFQREQNFHQLSPGRSYILISRQRARASALSLSYKFLRKEIYMEHVVMDGAARNEAHPL